MLVLTRSVRERIKCDLGDGRVVTLMVTSVSGKHVKLGFDAPMSVRITREEVDFQRPKSLENPRNTSCIQQGQRV